MKSVSKRQISISSKNSSSSREEDEFEEICELGKGSYGRVVAVRHKIDGEQYAIKRVALPRNRDHGKLYREVTMLAKLQHTNIVRYFGAWTELSDRYDDENLTESIELSSESNSLSWGELGFEIEKGSASSTDEEKSSLKSQAFSNDDTTRCAICHQKYDDWEVTFDDWNRLGSHLQPLSLCITCYTTALKSLNVDLAQVSFVKRPKKQLYLCIKMELATATLKDCMNDIGPKHLHLRNASSDVLFDIMHQLFSGLEFLHQRHVVHRDIKPTNLFLIQNDKGSIVLKIGDLGLARRLNNIDDGERKDEDNKRLEEDEETTGVGSLLYLPPTPDASPSQDIFASGIVLIELLTRFSTEMERRKTLNTIHQHLKENPVLLTKYLPPRITETHPTVISTLLCSMLHPKSSSRPTASSLLATFSSSSSVIMNNEDSSSKLSKSDLEALDEVQKVLLSRGLSPDETIHRFSSYLKMNNKNNN